MQTDVTISKGLKSLFVISGVMGTLYGVVYTFFSPLYRTWMQWPFIDPIFSGLLGGTFLSLAIGSFLALKETVWSRVELYVTFVIAWLLFNTLYSLWSVFYFPLSSVTIAGVLMDAVFTTCMMIFYLYYYLTNRKKSA